MICTHSYRRAAVHPERTTTVRPGRVSMYPVGAPCRRGFNVHSSARVRDSQFNLPPFLVNPLVCTGRFVGCSLGGKNSALSIPIRSLGLTSFKELLILAVPPTTYIVSVRFGTSFF